MALLLAGLGAAPGPGQAARGGEVPSPAIDLAAWIDGGSDADTAARLAPSLSSLTTLFPVLHVYSGAGIRDVGGEGAQDLIARAEDLGLAVLPAVQNLGDSGFDAGPVRAMLADPAARARHVAALAGDVVGDRLDGLNLDYESLAPGDRDAFTAFVAELGAALHARGKRLTVCVPARTSADPTWDAPRAFDYVGLAHMADELVYLAYDWSWPGGEPGPIAPLGWVREVARFAVAASPAASVRLGLPLYGYDWGGPRTLPVPQRDLPTWGAARGEPMGPPALPEAARGMDVGSVFRAAYRDAEGRTHRVFGEPASGLQEKIAAGRTLGVTRFALWRAEYGEATTIEAVSRERRGGTPIVTEDDSVR